MRGPLSQTKLLKLFGLQKTFFVRTLLPYFLLLMAFFLQNSVRHYSVDSSYDILEPTRYLGLKINPKFIRRFLGTRLMVADLVWIDLLIKADISRVKEPFTTLYHASRTVVTLDPDQLYAYYVSGMYLSVIKDDIKGATAILRDGANHIINHDLHLHPTAWKVFFMLGYNLIFEEFDLEEGGFWIRKAGSAVGAPQYVTDLSNRVATERGRLDLGARVLSDLYRRTQSTEEKKRIEEKLLLLTAKQDLAVINERFQNFIRTTRASALPAEKSFKLFLRTEGIKKDILGRKLKITEAGKIEATSN